MTNLSAFGALIAMAILTEATVQVLFKDASSPLSKYISYFKLNNYDLGSAIVRLISVLIGVAYAFNMGLDIFLILGFNSKVPYVGTIATGVLASRGSNFIHDLLSRLLKKDEEFII